MARFIVATDSGCDLPISLCNEKEIRALRLVYRFGDEQVLDSMDWDDCHAFYERMRAGEIPKTSQVNVMQFIDFWTPLLAENLPVVHICLGSGISGTYQSALQALELIKAEHPDADIRVVDSTLASVGYGVLALRAAEIRDRGADASECVEWLEKNKARMNTWYTTSDLKYLYQSGRVSRTGLIVATALNIRPILNLDLEGHLIVQDKCRGEKAAMKRIEDTIGRLCPEDMRDQTLYVCHSDIPEEARVFGERLKEKFGFRDVYYTYIGPTIGANCGPGLKAAFFFGLPRSMDKQ